jgi:hypothetical protein
MFKSLFFNKLLLATQSCICEPPTAGALLAGLVPAFVTPRTFNLPRLSA